MYKTIGIIPARKGSKGLPGKNIKNLCGKPLIAWTIENAIKSNLIDELVVSTDSNEIAKISKNYGAKVPFLRPEIFSTDNATSLSVVEHCLNFYRENQNKSFDIVALLEPTSPLREKNDLDKMINILKENYDKFDAVVSIGEVRDHPAYMKTIGETGIISPLIKDLMIRGRRQDEKKVFFPFGVCYLIKTSSLMSQKTFYPKRTFGYKISKSQCIEIDNLIDFLLVETIIKNNLELIY